MWFCYLIESDEGYTYNGMTNNISRRLRQHNGQLKGGAFKTQKGTRWQYKALLTGFEDQINCLQCEWRIKYPFGKHRSASKPRKMSQRIRALAQVLCLPKWTRKAVPHHTLVGWVHEDYWFDWEEAALEQEQTPNVRMETGPLNDDVVRAMEVHGRGRV